MISSERIYYIFIKCRATMNARVYRTEKTAEIWYRAWSWTMKCIPIAKNSSDRQGKLWVLPDFTWYRSNHYIEVITTFASSSNRIFMGNLDESRGIGTKNAIIHQHKSPVSQYVFVDLFFLPIILFLTFKT